MIESSRTSLLGCLVAVVSLGILGVDCRFGGLASDTDVIGAYDLALIKDSESTKSKCRVLWDNICAFIDGECGAEMFLQTVEHYANLGNGDDYDIEDEKSKMSSVCRLHSGWALEQFQFQLTNSIRFPTKWSKVKMTVDDISALSKQHLNQITKLPKQRQFLFDSRDRFRKLWEKHFPGKDSAEQLDVKNRDVKSILLQFCDSFQSGVSKDSKEGKSEFTKYALPRYYSLVGMTGIVGEAERGNFRFQLNNCLLDSDGYLTVRWNTGKAAEVVCEGGEGGNGKCKIIFPEANIPGYEPWTYEILERALPSYEDAMRGSLPTYEEILRRQNNSYAGDLPRS